MLIAKKGKTGRLIGSVLPESSHTNIRWGSIRYPEVESINSVDAIKLAANKPLCRKTLAQEGIPVPRLINLEEPFEFPIVGRTTKHSKGKGFYYCTNELSVDHAISKGATYFSEFYPKTEEYRVHIAGGKVLLFSIKNGDKSKHVWNTANGFTFRHMRRSEWLNSSRLMDIQRDCKRAMVVVGLDFGCVDVLAGASSPFLPHVISEINTAPGLSPLAIEKYVTFFEKEIAKRRTLDVIHERLEESSSSVRSV